MPGEPGEKVPAIVCTFQQVMQKSVCERVLGKFPREREGGRGWKISCYYPCTLLAEVANNFWNCVANFCPETRVATRLLALDMPQDLSGLQELSLPPVAPLALNGIMLETI